MTLLLLWLAAGGPLWAAGGAFLLPARYRARGLDPTPVSTASLAWGAAFGPFLAYLYVKTPPLRPSLHVALPSAILVVELLALFAALDPTNPCLTSAGYLANQLVASLTLGAVYATMAVGLTLIFSVLNIVNLAHGQIVMLGGILAFYLLAAIPELNPLAAIPVAGVVGFGVGLAFNAVLLKPMHRGEIERADDYAVLVTYGAGLCIMYALPGLLGPTPGLMSPGFTDRPGFGLENLASLYVVGPLYIRTNTVISGAVGVILLVALGVFLSTTWTGRSLRAVSQDPDAATAAGVDKMRAFAIAFALGCALAMIGGAALIPVLAFSVPIVALQIAITSWVIIVLGGLGSITGAILGSFIVSGIQAASVACFPDPSRGSAYQTVFALLIFAIVLLVRPQGLFGRPS